MAFRSPFGPFPDEPYDYTPRLRQLASAIDRAGITINTIDQGDAVATGSKETIEEFPGGTGGKAYSSGTLDKALPEVLNAPLPPTSSNTRRLSRMENITSSR